MFRINKGHILGEGEYAKVTKYCEPDYALFHNHDFFEIEYVIDGEGKHLIENDEFEVSKGDVYFTNKSTPHCFVSNGKKEQVLLYNCVFTSDFFSDIKIDFCNMQNAEVEAVAVKFFPVFMRDVSFIKLRDRNKVLYKMFSESYENKKCSKELLSKIILFIIGECEKKMDISKDREMILSALYIEENFKKQIKTEELASMFFMSRDYFGKKFKGFFGMGVKEYCQRKIIEDVAKKLIGSRESFEKISHDAGYSNVAYLRNLFKRHKGMSPGEYKRRNLLLEDA